MGRKDKHSGGPFVLYVDVGKVRNPQLRLVLSRGLLFPSFPSPRAVNHEHSQRCGTQTTRSLLCRMAQLSPRSAVRTRRGLRN